MDPIVLFEFSNLSIVEEGIGGVAKEVYHVGGVSVGRGVDAVDEGGPPGIASDLGPNHFSDVEVGSWGI